MGYPWPPGMEMGYVVRDARKWKADPERTAKGFDSGYYGKLLGKAWEEAAFVFSGGGFLAGEKSRLESRDAKV